MKTLYQQRQLSNVKGNPLREYFEKRDERRRNSGLLEEESLDELERKVLGGLKEYKKLLTDYSAEGRNPYSCIKEKEIIRRCEEELFLLRKLEIVLKKYQLKQSVINNK